MVSITSAHWTPATFTPYSNLLATSNLANYTFCLSPEKERKGAFKRIELLIFISHVYLLMADSATERDLRASLQHAVAQICLEEEMTDDSAHMSTQAVAALSELIYQYATKSLSNDLLAFSRHANRRTITLEDVLLMARKDPQLQEKLQTFMEREKLSPPKGSTSSKKKKRRTMLLRNRKWHSEWETWTSC